MLLLVYYVFTTDYYCVTTFGCFVLIKLETVRESLRKFEKVRDSPRRLEKVLVASVGQEWSLYWR